MKNFKLLLAAIMAFTPMTGFSGTDAKFNSVTGAEYNTNLIKNPSARDNALGITTSNATATRGTTNKINGVASWLITTTALNGYVEFALDAASQEQESGLCVFKGKVKGNSSLHRARVLDSGAVVLSETGVLGNNTDWNNYKIVYPCGVGRKVRITQTEAGSAVAFSAGKLIYGSADGEIGSLSKDTFSAKVSSAGVVSDEAPFGSDWINGNCAVSDTSLFTCTFTSSFFNIIPNCDVSASLDNSGASQGAVTDSTSTSLVKIRTLSGGGKSALPTVLTCTKTGADSSSFPITSVSSPSAPKYVEFLSSGTYTPTPGTKEVVFEVIGGGGGGAGNGTSGGSGGDTLFGSVVTATGGTGGAGSGGAGGTGGTVTVSPTATSKIPGSNGSASSNPINAAGGNGGASCLGGAGGGGQSGANGTAGKANTGGGGGGGGANGAGGATAGSGGGAGGCARGSILSPASSYTITIGAAGSAGGGTPAGSLGGSGAVRIWEKFSTSDVISFQGMVTSDDSTKSYKEFSAYSSSCSGSSCTIASQEGTTISAIPRVGAGLYSVSFSGLSVAPLWCDCQSVGATEQSCHVYNITNTGAAQLRTVQVGTSSYTESLQLRVWCKVAK